jgi:hypothetical protein
MEIKKLVDDIEDKICRQKLTISQVFTKMKWLIQLQEQKREKLRNQLAKQLDYTNKLYAENQILKSR